MSDKIEESYEKLRKAIIDQFRIYYPDLNVDSPNASAVIDAIAKDVKEYGENFKKLMEQYIGKE